MNKDRQKAEDLLSQYIDDLNNEKKPRDLLEDADLSDTEAEELADLFETVKAVRRIKDIPEPVSEEPVSGRTRKTALPDNHKKRWFVRATSIAALFLLMMTGFFQLNRSDTPFTIVYAMIQAYEDISALEGVMEFTLRNGQEVLVEETRLITYQKPDKFRVVTITKARTFTKVYDGGDKMVSFRGDGSGDIIVDYMSDELMDFFLEDYHIGTHIYKLEGAIAIEKIGEETIHGRETYLYHYRFTMEDPVHRMWVDKSTYLPLKMESNYKNGDQIIREYSSVTINPSIDPEVFSFEIADKMDVHETSPPVEQEPAETVAEPDYDQILTVTFEGRIDSHSAEFTKNGEFLVLLIGEEVAEYFDTLPPGTEIRVRTEESPVSTNRMITSVEP